MIEWLLVDDKPDEAEQFARALSVKGMFVVTSIRAKDAEDRLGKGELRPSGVLMDVDLSSETGMRSTGPGMAQNIRVAQQRQSAPSFPIVRFSARARVLENIGHDSSSDDVFDLKIEKDGLSEIARQKVVQRQLFGVTEVYHAAGGEFDLLTFVGLDDKHWSLWGHLAFEREMANADRPHLKAGRIIRLLVHPGVLIDEDLLAIRLGIDRHQSKSWSQLLDELAPIRYSGVARDHFPRWWARGLEDWWLDLSPPQPLAGSSIEERHALLTRYHSDLRRLEMPEESPGDRPWRTCLLTLEEREEIIPVDPSKGVRITPRETLPPWMDPFVAVLGRALQSRDDPRLDRADLDRLSRWAKRGSR
ncbi:hypothetical protein [Inquilinus sp. OTU3971]|uniref:hypothetical protein n=1 Tax=Inquilinus sp. OTU3971 TaxID=3043855 RepID=UPI00313DCC72